MAKRNKSYVLFTLSNNYGTNTFTWKGTKYTRKALVGKLAISEVYQKDNSILNNLSKNMCETSLTKEYVENEYCLMGGYVRYNPLYFIARFDKNGYYAVNAETLRNDVADAVAEIVLRRGKVLSKNRIKNTYVFRKDPVPCIHRYKFRNYYRSPKNHRTKVQSSIVEYKEFIKPAHRNVNLPVWDDLPRHRDKSWKTSYKVKKQWMKNI